MKYLVKMTPIEPYAFGTDQTFQYHGVDATGKETYFMRSNQVPEQTTILGMLRYIVLEMEGLLNSDFHYTAEEREKMNACIGRESFRFLQKEKQDFGMIHEISPVFLMDAKDHIYIKNPYHNKSNETFVPMELSEKTYRTSVGLMRLPKTDKYHAKQGHASGYYDLTDGMVCQEELFVSRILTGNRKNGYTDEKEDGFFKREVIELKKGFSFAVYVEADCLPKQTIAYMGQKKSAFQITATETNDPSLAEQVRGHKAFSEQKEIWYYALSDHVLEQNVKYERFCMVEEKQIRNLETISQSGRYVQKLKRSDRQYNLVQSGSVFHEMCPFGEAPENWKQIGYNQMVQLGGK